MRLLLDTCAFIWMAAGDPRLSSPAEAACRSGTNELLLSAASSWERAIKFRLGRLTLPGEPERFVPEAMGALALTALPVMHSHSLRVAALPAHHGDPFDRLLVAQGQLEGLTIVSPDALFDAYGVARLW